MVGRHDGSAIAIIAATALPCRLAAHGARHGSTAPAAPVCLACRLVAGGRWRRVVPGPWPVRWWDGFFYVGETDDIKKRLTQHRCARGCAPTMVVVLLYGVFAWGNAVPSSSSSRRVLWRRHTFDRPAAACMHRVSGSCGGHSLAGPTCVPLLPRRRVETRERREQGRALKAGGAGRAGGRAGGLAGWRAWPGQGGWHRLPAQAGAACRPTSAPQVEQVVGSQATPARGLTHAFMPLQLLTNRLAPTYPPGPASTAQARDPQRHTC